MKTGAKPYPLEGHMEPQRRLQEPSTIGLNVRFAAASQQASFLQLCAPVFLKQTHPDSPRPIELFRGADEVMPEPLPAHGPTHSGDIRCHQGLLFPCQKGVTPCIAKSFLLWDCPQRRGHLGGLPHPYPRTSTEEEVAGQSLQY